MRERKRKIFNQNYKSNIFLGKGSMVIASIGLLVMLGLLYLSQSNAIALKGYSLSELERQKTELESERDRLQIEATRLQSIQEIQNTQSNTDSNYIPVKKINYLPSTNVAVR